MRTTFTFAGRVVRAEHPTLCGALSQARHVVNSWVTVPSVVIHGDRRGGYPDVGTVTRDTTVRH